VKARYSALFIAVFFGMLLLPLRTLKLDPYTIEELFFGRAQLIEWIANLRISLGDRVFPKVLMGNNGWLVYTAEGDLDDYQKSDPFSRKELKRIGQRLDDLTAQYVQQGTTLLIVVPPNKSTIYLESVPPEIPVLGKVSRLDQLAAYLKANENITFIDLRPALLRAKKDGQIYYATDTHWNDLGAYVAYDAIMTELQKDFPGLRAHPLSDFHIEKAEPELLDLTRIMGTTLIPEERVQLAPTFETHTSYRDIPVGNRRITFLHNPDDTLPSLVLYYDSFFLRVNPLLGEHFREGIMVQNFMAGSLWTLDWVEETKPDVVIIELTERYLGQLLKFIERD
jgi:hypothetical protein